MKLLLALSMLFASAKTFAYSEIGLNHLIKDARRAYDWYCKGSACYGVWSEQMRALNELSTFIDTHITTETEVSTDIGTKARKLAYYICASSAIGDADWIIKLVSAENRAIQRLKLLQRRAKIKSIQSCKKEVQ